MGSSSSRYRNPSRSRIESISTCVPVREDETRNWSGCWRSARPWSPTIEESKVPARAGWCWPTRKATNPAFSGAKSSCESPGPTGDEHELHPRAIRSISDLVHDESCGHERLLDVLPAPEAEGGRRLDHLPVLFEYERPHEGDQLSVDLGHPIPRPNEPLPRDGLFLVGVVRCPGLPGPSRRITHFEDQPAAVPEGGVDCPLVGVPLLIGENRLGDVGGHEGRIHRNRRQVGCHAVYPLDPIGSWLGSGYVERSTSRIDCHDIDATQGELAGESAGTASHVEDRPSSELLHHRRIHVQVAAVRVERVVQTRQTRVIEDRIGGHDLES